MQSPVSLQEPLILPRIPSNAFRSPGYWRSIVFATDSLRGIIASTDHERTVSNMVFKIEKAGFVSPGLLCSKELLNQVSEVIPASRIPCRKAFFDTPILKDVEQIMLKRR